jgi:hypothetical protein
MLIFERQNICMISCRNINIDQNLLNIKLEAN